MYGAMKRLPSSFRPIAWIALAVAALAATTGLAFASWLDNGARMLMALTESGLAWCF